jgi:hypothetical protein
MENLAFSKEINYITEIRMPKMGTLKDTIIGELIFNMKLDSTLESRMIKRYTFLYVTTKNLDTVTAKSIQKVEHKTFRDTTQTGRFKFYSIFDKLGEITFVIEDNLLLKPLDTNDAIEIRTADFARKVKYELEN